MDSVIDQATDSKAAGNLVAAPQDVQQLLEDKLEHARELHAQVEQTLSAANDQTPVLKFLEKIPSIPALVRESAASHLMDLRSYVLYLQSVEVAVESWSANLRAALEEAKLHDDHRTVEPSTHWLNLIGADHAAPLQAAYQKIEARPKAGVELSAALKRFLEEHRKLLGNMVDVGWSYLPVGSGAGSVPVPEALRTQWNHQSILLADWDIFARLFEFGDPVDHNLNLRRFKFSDESAVEIQSFQPVLMHGARSHKVQAAGGVSGMAVGAMVGGAIGQAVAANRMVAGPATLAMDALGAGATGAEVAAAQTAVGAEVFSATLDGLLMGAGIGLVVGGLATVLILGATLAKDSAWQGYAVSTFSKEKPHEVVRTRYFSVVNRSNSALNRVLIHNGGDLDTFGNFADDPKESYATHWWTDSATVRSPVFDGSGLNQSAGDALVPLKSGVDQLVQALARFAPEGAVAGAATVPADALAPDRSQALLALSH